MTKYLALGPLVLALTACSAEAEQQPGIAQPTEVMGLAATPASADPVKKLEANEMPNFADYPGVCPKDWGIVVGATRAHVERFIQNYFYVPEGGGSPMYSEINTYSVAGGATLIKAGTYKMLDPIVDQEMVVTFAAGAMTQCGSRLRCETDPTAWVAECD